MSIHNKLFGITTQKQVHLHIRHAFSQIFHQIFIICNIWKLKHSLVQTFSYQKWYIHKQIHRNTVKPVCKDHSIEPEHVAFISSCPLYTVNPGVILMLYITLAVECRHWLHRKVIYIMKSYVPWLDRLFMLCACRWKIMNGFHCNQSAMLWKNLLLVLVLLLNRRYLGAALKFLL
jgi:hypothetical protein